MIILVGLGAPIVSSQRTGVAVQLNTAAISVVASFGHGEGCERGKYCLLGHIASKKAKTLPYGFCLPRFPVKTHRTPGIVHHSGRKYNPPLHSDVNIKR